MSVPIDRTTYDGLHPSDRLALQFHAVLAAPDETKRQAQLARLDAWVAELGPRFDESEIQPLLAACQGTPLEPVRLGPVASGLVYGHFSRKSTIPVGVRSRLQVENGRADLTVLEPVAAAR